jgi:fumarate reductase subunit D
MEPQERQRAHQRRRGPDRFQGLMWLALITFAGITAFLVPAHILIQGVLGPLGLVPSFDRRYESFAAALSNPLIKLYLFLLVVMTFYVLGHRARYFIAEAGVAKGKAFIATVVFVPVAIAVVIAGYLIFTTP